MTQEQEQTMEFRTDMEKLSEDHFPVEYINAQYTEDALRHDIYDVLNRPYEIFSGTWNGTQVASTNILNLYPIEELLKKQNFSNKFSNFHFRKFNIKIRLMGNFQSFQMGKLLLSAYPEAPSRIDQNQQRLATLYTRSTWRKIELDAGSQEEVELVLPFYNDLDVYEGLDTSRWRICLDVLNPLKGSTNAEEADVIVYASLDDIEMTLPSAQGSESQEKSSKGLISGTLDTVSTIAGSLKNVPILSDIAGPVEWISSAASGVASFFGFSKPQNQKAIQPVLNLPGQCLGNVDGIDSGHQLAASVDNTIKQLDIEDEMGISEFCKRQGLVSQGTWGFKDQKGHHIYLQEVKPFIEKVWSIGADQVRTYCPLSFMSKFFLYWHGDITYRFSFAKNRFYSGKLLVSFHPGKVTPAADDPNVYRRIISIRDTNDFTVTIPYVNAKEWNLCDQSIGTLSVQVLNRLQSADTVPNDIDFNVWVSSPNMKFSVPQAKWPKVKFSYKGQGIEKTTSNVLKEPSDDYLFRVKDVENPYQYTIGEAITNLRPLLRRFYWIEDAYQYRCFHPWVRNTSSNNKDIRLWSYVYRFYSGSTRFKTFLNEGEFAYIAQNEAGDKGFYNNGSKAFTCGTVNPIAEFTVPYYSDRKRLFTIGSASSRYEVKLWIYYCGDKGWTQSTIARPIYIASGDDFTYSFYMGIPPVVN